MGRKAIRLIPSSVQTDLERSIAEQLKVEPTPTVVKKFANGETYVNIKEDMRNKDVYLMPVIGHEVNDNLRSSWKASRAR